MKVLVDYPNGAEEAAIVRRMSVDPPRAHQILSPVHMEQLQHAADQMFVHDAVLDYAVRLVLATRQPGNDLAEIAPYIAHGASPRATLGLVAAGRALALMRGRNYVLPREIFDVAPDVLRHRVLLSYEALAEGVTAEHIVAKIVGTVGAPRVTPTQDGPVFERADVAAAS
jgi:MoxR-like ATPase